MTSEDKDSLVEMLAKIPVTETKGSLLSAIGKLLRVIDISENSIMIPTLLKDKCEFDAYEMLTLAKILKASILGHNDLVEFYMSESSSQFNNTSLAHHQQQLALCNGNGNGNGNGGGSGSSAASSSSSNNHNHNGTSRPHNNNNSNNNNNHHHQQQQQQHNFNHLSPIRQHSATPSLRSSTASDSTASSSSTSNSSTPMRTPSADSLGDTSSSSSNGAGGGGGGSGGLGLTNGLMMNGHHHHNGHNHHHLRHNNHNHNLMNANGGGGGGGNESSCNKSLQLQRMQLGQNGDPDSTVRLLLQIEQLKVFIPHVTGIFESIIELYKSSVDAITYGGSTLSGHK